MEEFDLNALRNSIKHEKDVPATFTKEEEKSQLETQINRLEESSEPPSALEIFIKSSSEEQQQEVERVARNRNLEPGSYTIDTRKAELEHDLINNPSLRKIRISALKSKLEKLKTGL